MQLARQHFADKGVHVDLIKLYGSMELAPLTGLADAIVDLVSTGSTLKANQLVEVEHIMDISARLVVNPASLKLKRESLRPVIESLAAVCVVTAMTAVRIARLATTATRLRRAAAARAALVAQTDRGDRRARWPASSTTCARAATPRCAAAHARLDGVQAAAGGRPRGPARRAAGSALENLPAAQRDALQAAALRVRSYHEHQLRASCQSWQIRDADGSLLGQKVTPLGSRGHLRARRQGGVPVVGV